MNIKLCGSARLGIATIMCVASLLFSGQITLGYQGNTRGGCEVVEVYPGYPGYRGLVTGIRPVGDHACLDDLKRLDSGFSRSDEDAKNRRAARNLGLAGIFTDWTWENWMAIEVERGDAPQCYSCLILDPSIQANTAGVEYDPTDPRILISLTDIRVLAPYLLEDIADISNPGRFQIETAVWRTLASMNIVDLGSHLNAPQVLENMKFWIGEYHGIDVDGDGNWSGFDLDYSLRAFKKMGGYTPISGIEYLQDQVYEAYSVIWMFYNFSTPMFKDSFLQSAETTVQNCQFNAGRDGYESIGDCVSHEMLL